VALRTTCLSMTFSALETLSGLHLQLQDSSRDPTLRLTKQDQRQFRTFRASPELLSSASETDLVQPRSDRERYASASQCHPTRHHILNKDDRFGRHPPPVMEDITLCRNNLPSSARTQWTRDGSVFVLLLFTRVIESEQMSRPP
jgi:hypothetical protein